MLIATIPYAARAVGVAMLILTSTLPHLPMAPVVRSCRANSLLVRCQGRASLALPMPMCRRCSSPPHRHLISSHLMTSVVCSCDVDRLSVRCFVWAPLVLLLCACGRCFSSSHNHLICWWHLDCTRVTPIAFGCTDYNLTTISPPSHLLLASLACSCNAYRL